MASISATYAQVPGGASQRPTAGVVPRAAVASPVDDPSPWIVRDVTLERPLDAIPTMLNNLVEHFTGYRDDRIGRAASQVLLAGQQMIVAGLRAGGRGTGAIAAGSSVLSKVLPAAGIAMGAWQVVKGWNELADHSDGPFSLIHSKTARTGVLQMLAGALLFIPGVGTALGGVGLRLAAAANEMDLFQALDGPTKPVEEQGRVAARIAHPFDRTPTNEADNTSWSDHVNQRRQQQEADPLGKVLVAMRDGIFGS